MHSQYHHISISSTYMYMYGHLPTPVFHSIFYMQTYSQVSASFGEHGARWDKHDSAGLHRTLLLYLLHKFPFPFLQEKVHLKYMWPKTKLSLTLIKSLCYTVLYIQCLAVPWLLKYKPRFSTGGFQTGRCMGTHADNINSIAFVKLSMHVWCKHTFFVHVVLKYFLCFRI